VKKTVPCLLAVSFLFLTTGPVSAQEVHIGPVTEFVDANVKPWLSDPVIIDAIRAQNLAHATLTQVDIDALDARWRAEMDGNAKPMVDAVLANPLSQFLKARQHEAGGLVTEAFVMDNKGLNVGQSDVTSDFWQGDEAKWQKSFGAGPDAVFIDGAEKDESTQMLQSQASISIKDPATGKAIGAITIGVNLDAL
jgi:hypothetical protein